MTVGCKPLAYNSPVSFCRSANQVLTHAVRAAASQLNFSHSVAARASRRALVGASFVAVIVYDPRARLKAHASLKRYV